MVKKEDIQLLQNSDISMLEKLSKPGVYFFIQKNPKTTVKENKNLIQDNEIVDGDQGSDDRPFIWISFATDMLHSINRNIRLIAKEKHRGVSNIDEIGFIPLDIENGKGYLAVNDLSEIYVNLGYNVRSRTFKYYLRGYIGKDYRTSDKGVYLYYIGLYTRNHLVKVLAICENGSRGKEVLDYGKLNGVEEMARFLSPREVHLANEYNTIGHVYEFERFLGV